MSRAMLNSLKDAIKGFQFKSRGTVSTGIDGIDERLAQLLAISEDDDDDEIIPPKELEESEAAWQDYLTGRDKGEPLSKVRQERLQGTKTKWTAFKHPPCGDGIWRQGKRGGFKHN